MDQDHKAHTTHILQKQMALISPLVIVTWLKMHFIFSIMNVKLPVKRIAQIPLNWSAIVFIEERGHDLDINTKYYILILLICIDIIIGIKPNKCVTWMF